MWGGWGGGGRQTHADEIRQLQEKYKEAANRGVEGEASLAPIEQFIRDGV